MTKKLQPVLMIYADCVCMLSHVWLFLTPWTVAHWAPLSMGFSRQEYWGGLPCPPPEDLRDVGIKLTSLASPALAGRFFTTSTTWKTTDDINTRHSTSSTCPALASPCVPSTWSTLPTGKSTIILITMKRYKEENHMIISINASKELNSVHILNKKMLE